MLLLMFVAIEAGCSSTACSVAGTEGRTAILYIFLWEGRIPNNG